MFTMADAGSNVSHHLARTSPIPTDPVYEDYGGPCNKPSTAPPGGGRCSPIPKDPTYANPSEYKTATPKPRVKPEALNIARNHQGRDLAYLFNPAFKVLPIGVKHTHRTPRDHEKENYRKIKQIQKANKEKHSSQSCRTSPVKAVYKPDKFGHVQSVVAQQIQTPNAPRNVPSLKLQRSKSQSDIERSKPPSRKNSRQEQLGTKTIPNNNSSNNNNNTDQLGITGDKIKTVSKATTVTDGKCKRPSSALNVKENNTTTVVSKRPPRPSSACELGRKSKEPLSHIALNKQAVQKTKLKKNPSDTALQELREKKENDIKNHKRGNVPKYLRNRQNEWKKEEEERIANLPDPTVPPGHTVMAEGERVHTLTLLQKSQQEMLDELKTIPLSRDTVRIKQRKDAIERKLTEIDTAMKIFSRPRVFIKDE